LLTRRSTRFTHGLAVALLLLLGSTAPAAAERIASRTDPAAEARSADLARVSDALAEAGVARALAAQGLSASEVEDRLGRLSDEDVRRLAANVEQVRAAGQVPNYIWILLGIFLAVSIIVMIA
jgi:hypothetical protein